ncbi:MAG TPA: heme peroxidase family protein [Pyrinomonadaceae bacterium]|nr:heme peroxidase family protein [Pyrinomonadaceae bacterium]
MKKVSTQSKPPKTVDSQGQKFHGSQPRGLKSVSSSFSTEGRFGRMFRNAPIYEHKPENLAALAKSMIVAANPKDLNPVEFPLKAGESDNPTIPSGYVYFGQFIDHDITFDPASSLQKQNDPDALHNFRTPRFDLDSLYGRGPADQPYLYMNSDSPLPHPVFGFDRRGIMFLIDEQTDRNEADLPRNANGRALIGDPRNDENIIVSQLHLVFLKFHNKMVELVFKQSGLTGNDLFLEAQRMVRWHYQWVIFHDFLPRILDGKTDESTIQPSEILNDILIREKYTTINGGIGTFLKTNLRFYHWHNTPFLPVEFSVAAYRFGHSMVRSSYFINDFVRQENKNMPIPIFSASRNPLENLNGFRPLPTAWGIGWKYFFEIETDFPPQSSFKIDTKISNPLSNLPSISEMPNLAHRNLMRGFQMNLPSGQSIAKAMGIHPLSDDELQLSKRGAPDFEGDAPLWFYILREAEILAKGIHLGPVGGRIVGEVFAGLLAGDPFSWFNIEPNWRPTLSVNGKFKMSDLIRFTVGESVNDMTSQQPPQAASASGILTNWREVFPQNNSDSSTFIPK